MGCAVFFLFLTVTALIVVGIFLRDTAVHWILLDMNHQHNMALSLISRIMYFNVLIWVLIWRNTASFSQWLIVMGGLCTVLFPLAVFGMEATDTRLGIMTLTSERGNRLALYVVLFLFELLQTFVIAAVAHRFVGNGRRS